MLKLELLILLFIPIILISQEDIYISKNANLVAFPNSNIAIFGNVINDAKGGLTYQNNNQSANTAIGSNVYLIRHKEHGVGNSKIYGGPNSETYDEFNKDGSYCRFWNLITDNTIGISIPSKTLVKQDFGTGNIQIEQEIKINNSHTLLNGMVWTPRSKWTSTFLNYEKLNLNDSIKIIGYSDSKHIDGYAVSSGNTNKSIFPIGDGKKLRVCGVSTEKEQNIRVAYFNQNPLSNLSGISGILPSYQDSINLDEKITAISGSEFWDIDADSEIQIFLSLNNYTGDYSNWYEDFNKSAKINIVGFDGKWKNLGLGFSINENSNDTICNSNKFIASKNHSLFTWAEIDTNISNVKQKTNIDQYIYIENEKSSQININFSFDYFGHANLLIFNLFGELIFKDNFLVFEGNNIYPLKTDIFPLQLYFIEILTEKDRLFYKFFNVGLR